MSYSNFLTKISQSLPQERLLDSPAERLAHGTDASFYRLTPKLVVKAATEQQVGSLIKAAAEEGVPLTFRTAGTSLSGQAVTDSVLVKLGHDWKGFNIEESGKLISLQPGIIGSWANRLLKNHQRKIGPDPASIDSAMIGGIVANNASGMCCGTAQNSYQTLAGMKLVLADGTILHSRDQVSVDAFRKSHENLLNSLTELRQEIIADPSLHEMVERKYKIKNTCGYGLNSLIDFEDPLDILLHLMVGSEGTLGFISEVTYHTVDDPEFTSCALVIFDSIDTACRATAALKTTPVSAVELMDDRALRLMHGRPGMPETFVEGSMALLVDVRGSSTEELAQKIEIVQQCIHEYGASSEFTDNTSDYAKLWKIRKGLFPIVGAERELGSTVIIEDICFPLNELAAGTLALQKLLDTHGYTEAVIFGHALEGNLHFVFTQDFNDLEEVKRYDGFMRSLATLMCDEFSGSLKAEHGTGRNMAPFVEVEWGHKAYNIMQRIKSLFDPKGILNPDVIISIKPELHISDLKQTPAADPLVDQCIECGFCESVCPSRDVTISPRQRIAVWREIQNRKAQGLPTEELLKEFKYLGVDTCAGDGMCASQCPVDIDTGKLVKQLRSESHGDTGSTIAQWTGDHFGFLSYFAKTGLKLAGVSRSLIGRHRINDFPNAARNSAFLGKPRHLKDVVYFNSCIHRMMGPDGGKEQFEVVSSLLDKAGYNVILPTSPDQLCCGLPYESKGYNDVASRKMEELKDELLKVSDGGRIPVICDNSPCSYLMLDNLGETALNIFDAPTFFASRLDKLNIKPSDEPILIYSVCSQQKAGESSALTAIAEACCSQVKITEQIACCGFGGDRGFSHPELNASALQTLPDQASGCCSGYSSSKTCDIGLKKHSGIPFNSILQLLDDHS